MLKLHFREISQSELSSHFEGFAVKLRSHSRGTAIGAKAAYSKNRFNEDTSHLIETLLIKPLP